MNCKACQNSASCIIALFNKNEQENAMKYMTNYKYKKGKAIFYEGLNSESFLTIKKGIVKLVRNESNNCQILRFAKAGDPIGYRSLITHDVHSTSAIPLTDTTVCSFPKNLFLDELNYNIALTDKMLQLVANDLKHTDALLVHLTHKTAIKRIAKALLNIADIFGLNEETKMLNTSFSRYDISCIASVSTESCIRMLSELKSKGIIDLINRSIKIIDKKQLELISSSE